MKTRSQWKTKLALVLAISLGTIPLLPFIAPTPATAQIFRRNRSRDDFSRDDFDETRTFRVVEGTNIAVALADDDATRIVVTPDETLDVTLKTTRPVRSTRGNVIIPEGSRIEGRIEPYQDGVRFVANRIEVVDGSTEDIEAYSDVITRRETVDGRRGNSDAIWQGALVGGAASTIISAAVTDVGILKTLLGAGAGALGGFLIEGRKRSSSREVVVIEPDRDLDLIVERDFLLSRRLAVR